MAKFNESEVLLSKQEAAEYLSTTIRHIERLQARRELSYRKLGKFVKFRKSDLDRYVDSCLVEAVK